MFAKLYTRLSNPYVDLISRGIFAIFGGLLLTALITINLTMLLPFEQPEAVMTAMILSFFIYGAIAMWAFCAASIWKAWAWFLSACLVSYLLIWMV